MRFQSTTISLLHMYRVHLALREFYSVVLISLNVMWNIRNEVDKTFVRTTKIDSLICNISIRVHGVICSITDKRLQIFLLLFQN